MHPESLRPTTRNCLALLARQDWLKGFYLAGGTGLALHLGHRFSEDLDFFTAHDVDPKKLRHLLAPLGKTRIEMEAEGTLWATFNNVKTSFFHYDYPVIEEMASVEGAAVAGLKDIACMKLDTISRRGGRKDFIDLYFVLREGYLLQDVFNWFREKYSKTEYNYAHLLKSLTYFEDAEAEAEPQMILPWNWEEIKRVFLREARRVVVTG